VYRINQFLYSIKGMQRGSVSTPSKSDSPWKEENLEQGVGRAHPERHNPLFRLLVDTKAIAQLELDSDSCAERLRLAQYEANPQLKKALLLGIM
jgi:hypothetical protein